MVYNNRNNVRTIKSSIILIAFFCFDGPKTMAQHYLHVRVGFGWGRYAPIDKEKLLLDEHNVNLGIITDVEYGKRLLLKCADEKFSLSLGGRFSYNLRRIEGTFTSVTWDPYTKINAHVFSVFLTTGAAMRVSKKFNAFFQFNIGPDLVLWYQDQKYIDYFWVFYMPVDLGIEYMLKDDLRLTLAVNAQIPIYKSTAETIMFGVRKSFNL